MNENGKKCTIFQKKSLIWHNQSQTYAVANLMQHRDNYCLRKLKFIFEEILNFTREHFLIQTF